MVPTRHTASLGVTYFLGLGQVGGKGVKTGRGGRTLLPLLVSCELPGKVPSLGKLPNFPRLPPPLPHCQIPAPPLPDSCPYSWLPRSSTFPFGLARTGLSVSLPRFCPSSLLPQRPHNTGLVHRECSVVLLEYDWVSPGTAQHGDCNSDGLTPYPSSTTGGIILAL